MLAKVISAAVIGIEAIEVEIEVNAGSGLAKIVIVGLPDTAVKESQDRVTTALHNSGYSWPQGKITINLAPADLKKEGPGFDLPIALGMIAATEGGPRRPTAEMLAGSCFVGELALNGRVRPTKGSLAIALECRRRGYRRLFVPSENAREAAVVREVEVFGVRSLDETVKVLAGELPCAPVSADPLAWLRGDPAGAPDFSDVKGQSMAKRAIEIAVSGHHNLLMIGPPGSGKSMLAKRIPSIMPPMTLEEAIVTTTIHSVNGLLSPESPLVAVRPFRAPHHTISDVGLLGGSSIPTPGEVSVAHHGVLFLDELPEFKRSTLEVMRQPLEDGRVTISRASGSMTFPAEFMLVAAMNPCPCGYYGDPKRPCRCSVAQVQRYRQRISGPLLDRIDLHIEVPAVGINELQSTTHEEPSIAIRERVVRARRKQQQRFAKHAGGVGANAFMTPRLIRQHCQLDKDGAEALRHAMLDRQMSARAYDRILKVARTIADLADQEVISTDHLFEALQFRELDRKSWT
ncbi:MAG: YifB family Mg chelatase-like AAA ATPase [Verrucomicrobiia bacterium]